MSMRIASAEIVSVFFMLIILLSLRTNTEKKSVSNRVFLAFTVSATVGLISDALSYITEEYRGNEFIQAVINVLAFATIDICIALFSFYLILLIRRKVNVSYRPVYPAVAISALNILLIILGTFNGRFFIVKDHHFVYGPWSDFLIVMPVFGMIAVLVVMIFYSKNLGKRNTVVLASVGYAYGNHEKVMKLVGYAEQEMYEDKSRYYAETGMDRRRENANTVIPKR